MATTLARNLFAEAERIAARAASASTRRQYETISRAFGDWLAGELGRLPGGIVAFRVFRSSSIGYPGQGPAINAAAA